MENTSSLQSTSHHKRILLLIHPARDRTFIAPRRHTAASVIKPARIHEFARASTNTAALALFALNITRPARNHVRKTNAEREVKNDSAINPRRIALFSAHDNFAFGERNSFHSSSADAINVLREGS